MKRLIRIFIDGYNYQKHRNMQVIFEKGKLDIANFRIERLEGMLSTPEMFNPAEINQEIAFIKANQEQKKRDRDRVIRMTVDAPVTYKESECINSDWLNQQQKTYL